jgi:hypothetical protein
MEQHRIAWEAQLDRLGVYLKAKNKGARHGRKKISRMFSRSAASMTRRFSRFGMHGRFPRRSRSGGGPAVSR